MCTVTWEGLFYPLRVTQYCKLATQALHITYIDHEHQKTHTLRTNHRDYVCAIVYYSNVTVPGITGQPVTQSASHPVLSLCSVTEEEPPFTQHPSRRLSVLRYTTTLLFPYHRQAVSLWYVHPTVALKFYKCFLQCSRSWLGTEWHWQILTTR